MSDQAQWDPGAVGCILRRQLGLGDGTQEKRLGDNGRKLQHNPLMISSPYVWAKSGDSLLTNRTWQEWWAAPRLLGHKRLWFPSCSYSLWLFSQACSGGEGHTTEKKGCPLPIDSNELRLCLTADEEANPTKKHWVGLGADSAPAELEMLKFQLTTWLQLHERPWVRSILFAYSWTLNPKELCEILNVCYFKKLDLGIICYMAKGS